jgi:DNA-binding NtrC family response regulator
MYFSPGASDTENSYHDDNCVVPLVMTLKGSMSTILLVDDDPDVLESLEAILTITGYTVIPKLDAVAAIEVLRNGTLVDLILTDYRMPHMDGKEFLENLRLTAPAIPVVMLTACGSVETYLTSIGLGAYEYINKPVLASELRRVVNAALTGANKS